MPDDIPLNLDNLQDKLYANEESPDLADRQEKIKVLGVNQDGKREKIGNDPLNIKQATQSRAKRKKLIIAASIALGLVVLTIVATLLTSWYRQSRVVKDEQIFIQIEAPSAILSGEELEYFVNFRNDSKVGWQDVEVVLRLPDSFQGEEREVKETFAKLDSGEIAGFSVKGRILGELNSSTIAQASIAITPENFPSGRFDKQTEIASTITSVPYDVAILAATLTTPGQPVLVKFSVTNTTSDNLEAPILKLEPANGMTLATEDPQFSPGFSAEDSSWQLPALAAFESIERQAVVIPTGSPGEKKSLQAKILLGTGGKTYLQKQVSWTVDLASAELAINQTYNGAEATTIVRTGQVVKGVISYRNTGVRDLRDVIVTAKFDGEGFRADTLDLPAGSYDPGTSTITWTAASVPQLKTLAAGAAGELVYEFTITDADQFNTTGPDATNKILAITSSIDSADVTLAAGEEDQVISSRFIMAVASDIYLLADAFYDDGRLGITSTGPLPPQVGQTTTYTMRLRLGSSLNDLGEVRVVAILPDGVRFTGEEVLTVGELEHSERTGEVVWTIPLLPGTTGSGKPYAEANFQIAITPGADKLGQSISFLNSLVASGVDQFTELGLSNEVPGSQFPDTSTAAEDLGDVE